MRILVCGGSTGIGAAAVAAFLARGDDVLLADRSEPGAELLDSVAAHPGSLSVVRADFADPLAPTDVIAAALELWDGELDVLFYNAAVLESHPLADWTLDSWERSAAVNLRAPFFFIQAAEAALRRSGQGRIIVTSSTGALRGHAGMPAYHATKSGLLGLVRSVADELGPAGVTVNAVSPGWVDTPFNDSFWGFQDDADAALDELVSSIPLGYQASPDDIAGTILFLASDASRYITGQSIVVDGGYTAV
ncbi:SDR family NAD(P)-dependent oxidoreductase [Amnibacterium flavum]|uniref:NAD(P)-dependent oxidoreductase n=1 Tax=Amnibacterium flavum TaxID=2173173 RepID=A0A2V1HWN8_9MICO|nr:SDR family NAD(P)-dependent oxidoreductase [Amnibacterium flavum]PVZ94927.1 NAD(P)-dependent oxidoreductase [Amnibacterium flavum]